MAPSLSVFCFVSSLYFDLLICLVAAAAIFWFYGVCLERQNKIFKKNYL